MKKSGMMLAVLAALGMVAVGCDKKPADNKTPDGKGGTTDNKGGGGAAAEKFSFVEWDAWNGFGEGSKVAVEMDAAGNKMTMTTTLKKKEADKITVATVTKMGDNELPAQERVIEKPKAAAAGGKDECPKCKKPASGHADSKETKEKVKVGDKELETVVLDVKMKDCDGKETGSSKSWYSKEVPGWMVKMESKFGGMESKQQAVSFEKK